MCTYTFENKALTQYFNLSARCITSWAIFQIYFHEKFDELITTRVLMTKFASLTMEPKEKVKGFTERFMSTLNRYKEGTLPFDDLQ